LRKILSCAPEGDLRNVPLNGSRGNFDQVLPGGSFSRCSHVSGGFR
jgi:hypothetical protein